jgi:hypothetical protein
MMPPLVDLLNLLLYCVQQLGVVLGVGAESVLLVTYVLSMRDRVVDQKEQDFGRMIYAVLKIGLLLIILSGALITYVHLTFQESAIVFSPPYVFKWMLILILGALVVTFKNRPYPNYLWEGFLGANWLALFTVHVLAPLAYFADLLIFYAVGTIVFLLIWSLIVRLTEQPFTLVNSRGKENMLPPPGFITEKIIEKPQPPPVPKPMPKPAPVVVKVVLPPPVVHVSKPVPPPMPKPVVPSSPPPPPVIKPVFVEAPHKLEELSRPHDLELIAPMVVPEKPDLPPNSFIETIPVKPPIKPLEEGAQQQGSPDIGLATIRVMPRTPEEVEKHIRSMQSN